MPVKHNFRTRMLESLGKFYNILFEQETLNVM